MSGQTEKASALRRLATVDLELSLLAYLTWVGLKPLSRYEAELDGPTLAALGELGLETRHVRRKLLGHGIRHEQVFSASAALVELYAEVFEGQAVAIDRRLGLLEGQLFGFPPCCAVSYVDEGYLGNELETAEQAELFHWACPGCELTPLLVPRYREARRHLEAMLEQGAMSS